MRPMSKGVVAITPVSKTNGHTAAGELIDTNGFDFMTLDIILSAADVVSNVPSVLKLQEADTTDASNLADISEFKAGTGFTLATTMGTSTAVQNLYKFDVDLRGRKRYLKALVSPVTTQVIAGVANLHMAEQAPVSAAAAGALNVVRG